MLAQPGVKVAREIETGASGFKCIVVAVRWYEVRFVAVNPSCEFGRHA